MAVGEMMSRHMLIIPKILKNMLLSLFKLFPLFLEIHKCKKICRKNTSFDIRNWGDKLWSIHNVSMKIKINGKS